VSNAQVSQFWSWFGQVTQTLRFKRHINSLWFNGLIYGIITKEDCNRALSNHGVGAFLIRFSETYPGLFAVAYVSDEPPFEVKHYLVKPEDTGSQKTLPDFLREKPQFQYLYQYIPETTPPSPNSHNNHSSQANCQPKDHVLSVYYSKRNPKIQAENGYVSL